MVYPGLGGRAPKSRGVQSTASSKGPRAWCLGAPGLEGRHHPVPYRPPVMCLPESPGSGAGHMMTHTVATPQLDHGCKSRLQTRPHVWGTPLNPAQPQRLFGPETLDPGGQRSKRRAGTGRAGARQSCRKGAFPATPDAPSEVREQGGWHIKVCHLAPVQVTARIPPCSQHPTLCLPSGPHFRLSHRW